MTTMTSMVRERHLFEHDLDFYICVRGYADDHQTK